MFGERLKEIRKDKGLTLEDLALKYNAMFLGGLNKGTLSKYENGKQEPMISVVNNLATVLDISVDFLLDREVKVKGDKEKYLLQLIKDSGFTIETFATKCGLPEKDINALFVKGLSNAHGNVLLVICKELGIQTNELDNIPYRDENRPLSAYGEIKDIINKKGKELSVEERLEVIKLLAVL